MTILTKKARLPRASRKLYRVLNKRTINNDAYCIDVQYILLKLKKFLKELEYEII